MFDKILGMASVGSTIANAALMQRFLSGMISMLGLAVASAFAACMFVAAALSILYLVLLHLGCDPYITALAILSTLLVVTAALILVTVSHLKKLRHLPSSGLEERTGLGAISGVVEAFMEGLIKGKQPE